MDRSDCRDAVDVHGNTLNCPMHAVITSGSMIHLWTEAAGAGRRCGLGRNSASVSRRKVYELYGVGSDQVGF